MVAGHLREQNGYYRLILTWKSHDGKRREKSIPTDLEVKRGNKRRAMALLDKARQEFNPLNDKSYAGMQTYDFLRKWLHDNANRISPRLYGQYAYDVEKVLVPYFMANPVSLPDLEAKQLKLFFHNQRQSEGATAQEMVERHECIREALEYAIEIGWLERNPANGINPCADDAQVMFTDFILEWLELTRSRVEVTTYAAYKFNVERSIVPYFQERQYTLRDLERHPKYIQEYYQYKMGTGLTANTVIHHHANIRKCLQYAFQLGLIQSNPADRVERPRKAKFKSEVYNMDELNQLFEVIQGDPAELGVFLAAFYGLRRSEVVGLKWDAIDFDRKTITIRHTVTQVGLDGKSQIIARDGTKTKSSYRSLPLVKPFELLLRRLLIEREINRKMCGRSYNMEYWDYIYVNEMGELIRPDYLTQHFPDFLVKHGMKRIRFHDLRHSCASLLYANGVSLKEIQEWLGHSDIGTTSNIYTHLDFSSKISSANAIVGLFPEKIEAGGAREKNQGFAENPAARIGRIAK